MSADSLLCRSESLVCRSACSAESSRHEQISTTDDVVATRSTASASGASKQVEHRRFGLPDWETLGYCQAASSLAEDRADTEEGDALQVLYDTLGLQVVVQRRTSLERLCFCWDKQNMPIGVVAQDVLGLANKLMQLDHVNVLRCIEVAEDADCLYFLFEKFAATTLAAFIEAEMQTKWNQQEKGHFARAICAGVAQAANYSGLQHLDLCLESILVPLEKEYLCYPKVFGFGFFGVLYTVGQVERPTWAPEFRTLAQQAISQKRHGFIRDANKTEKGKWDSWGMGMLLYTISEGRLPFADGDASLSDALPFEASDSEARTVIEGLLSISVRDRLTTTQALKCQWFRKYWRFQSADVAAVFEHLDAFCSQSLPKRMFGRFLVQFLDEASMLKVASSFYMLDSDGDGAVSMMDLQHAARLAHTRGAKSACQRICDFLGSSASVSHNQFADSMAEEIIQGRALRLAFESIDVDGSQEITPEELYEALQDLDQGLTMEQVIAHIKTVESITNEGGDKDCNQDQAIDFAEFLRLFPECTRRMKLLEDRSACCTFEGSKHRDKFLSVREQANDWMNRLQLMQRQLQQNKGYAIEKFHGEEKRGDAMNNLYNGLRLADQAARNIPGPKVEAFAQQSNQKAQSKQKAQKRTKKKELILGYDTFMRVHAEETRWSKLFTHEYKELQRTKAKKDKGQMNEPDYLKAYYSVEAAIDKLTSTLKWAKGQAGEYESFLDVIDGTEPTLPPVSMAGRGLQAHSGEKPDAEAALLMEMAESRAGTKLSNDDDINPFRCLCGNGALELAASTKTQTINLS